MKDYMIIPNDAKIDSRLLGDSIGEVKEIFRLSRGRRGAAEEAEAAQRAGGGAVIAVEIIDVLTGKSKS